MGCGGNCGSGSRLGILGFTEINELIDQGVIEFADRSSVNPSSLNVTLGETFLVEARDDDSVSGVAYRALEYSKRESPRFVSINGSATLRPGGFCLASLKEKINLPSDIACHVMLRSSAARMGIEHLLAGWADPGYSGHLTLELKNMLQFNAVQLRSGDQVMQLIFHRVYDVPADRTYDKVSGKYSGDTGPQGVKREHAVKS